MVMGGRGFGGARGAMPGLITSMWRYRLGNSSGTPRQFSCPRRGCRICARIRADLIPQHLPHFEVLGLWFDVRHRLWVIGNANDSTFLDVFRDSVFLGRRSIACRRSWDQRPTLQGRWIAMTCDGETSEQPSVVRLFRIVEFAEEVGN